MLSLTLDGDPPAFLLWHSLGAGFISLTVLGPSALCRPSVWDLALLTSLGPLGSGAVFLHHCSPRPASPVQPDQGRCQMQIC